MNATIRRFLSLIVFFSVLAAPLLAAPQAPVELRVSDTPGWSGAYDEPVGLSPHLHFRVRHLTTGAASPAVKLKVQLSTDSGFSEVLWDSGFVAIASTANMSLTPAIPYSGPALLPGTTYMWRAAVQDDQNIPSAYSEVAAFEVAATGTCADLRVSTGVGTEEVQGNPVNVTVWPPSLSAEYVAGDQVNYAFVEVSRTADFFTTLWASGPVPTGALNAGQRTPAVSYAGPMLEPGDPYFWRIRVAQTMKGESAWSSAASSFVFLPPDPAMPAPGGFSRSNNSFGSAGYETSDLVACNWDGNNSPDIVEVTRSEPGTHTLYRNFGTSSPSPALPFGESRGGTSLAAVSDFDWNGAADIAVLDQYGLRVYVPDGEGGITLGNELPIPGFGEPVVLQVADMRWDGWLDIIVAYESCVLLIVNDEGVFESIEIMEGFANPVTDLLATDFEPDDGLQEMWIASGGMVYLCREFGWLQQEWSLGDITQIALADGANPLLPELILAGPQELIHCTVVGDGTGAVDLEPNVNFTHGQKSECIDLKGSNLDGVDAPEVVLVTAEGVTVWLRAGQNYELHEYVGHPGGAGNLAVVLADMNVDNFPDVVVGKADTPHAIHFNTPRIGANIANSQATQVQFGEAFVEFQVTLDAPPVSMVEVLCETYEEESGGGGGGDGDALPDPRDFLNSQVGPLPYTPSAIWLKFTPGQLSSTFRVPLTSYYQASLWTLHVRIVKVIGGFVSQQTATASVYAMPPTSGSSGQTSGAGVSRDWQIDGEVHDIVHANNNTYFGGDFNGITWDAQGVAALNLSGERKVKLPNLSGSVRTVAVHPDGSIYFGGFFTIDVGQSLQIKNIAKCDAAGNLVTGFAPNPNDAVNSIAFDSYDRVYFGGKFTELLQTPGRVHNRLAWVYCNGQIETAYGGSNHFGVANSYTPANAEVLVLKVARSGLASNTEYLLVGGEKFNYALRGAAPYTYSLPLGFSYAFGNFTGFEISGSRVLTGPAFSGPVNAIEVDTSRTIGYQASHPIVIGGAYSVGKYSPTIYTSNFLTVTNFNGEYWAQQGSLTPVHALKFDEHNHLWVGRRAQYSVGGTVLTEDPLSVFAWAALGQQWSYLQQPAGPFNISSGWVESFACGTDEILAVGNFVVVENGQNVAENLAVFSTEAVSLGARLTHITTTTNAWGPLRCAAACFNSGGHAGYAIVGPFSKLVIERDNLAAMDAAGHILPWAPRANGPVKAMATDGTKVYFGGAFSQVSGAPRHGVAVALANNDATSALNWIADVSGAQATVEDLVLTNGHLVIGGDFMSINGSQFNDVAAVFTSGSGTALVTNWDVNLMDGSVDQVYSLCLDGTRLFIGGSFLGISGQPSRPGLLAVSLPEAGAPQINPFNANVSWPCAVKDISVTPDHVIFVGDFSTVGGQPRTGIACCTRATATLTSLNPAPNGPIHCVTSTASGLVYIGGEFSTLTNDQGSGPVVLPRKGIAVLDTVGIVQSWTADVLTVGNPESVHVLKLEYGSQTKVWAGGCFTGAVVAGQDHLTWFGSSLSITTASLPAVNSGQPFPLTQIQLSEQVSCTWSTSGPADAWLDIDAQGVLSGTAPVIPHGAPLVVPLLIEANFGASGTASRWFQVTILPPPPPTVVSITGVTSVTEGNTVVKSPTPTWSVNLNQPFSTPVHVMIQYVDAGARNGYEYSPQVNQVIFYPSGLPVPTNLPAGTIATNTLSVQLPVTLYGDKVFDGVQRKFIIQLTSQTLNVSPDPFNGLKTVEILDDDPASTVPEPAYVLFAQVREDATAPANPQGVVSNQPFIAWQFGSDIPAETQGWWQVQVSKYSSFTSFAGGYSGPQTAGADEVFQLPAQLLENTQYYARVRVWPTSGGAGGSPSEWFTFAFRLNAPPLQAYGLSPTGTIFTARPKLTWYISDDPEGAPQHVVVHLTEVGGSGQSHLLDSRVSPYLFEYQSGGNWSQVNQLGIPAGVSVVRLQVPAAMALTPTPVTWDWSVDVSDPFETAVGTTINTIEVDPHYVIEGLYVDSNGTPLPSRQLNAVLLPSHTPLNSAPETTGPDGRFRFTLTNSLAPGEAIGVFVDPSAFDPATGNPFNEYAGAVIRFPGSDLVEASGTFAQLTLVLGTCHLDARGQGNFNLGDLALPSAPVTPIPGYAFTLTSNVLELAPSFERLELRAELRVRGTYGGAGEPSSLVLSTAASQTLIIKTEGELRVEEGASVECHSLAILGSALIEGGASLYLTGGVTLDGSFNLAGGTLTLANANFQQCSGSSCLVDGSVIGTSGSEVLSIQGGSASLIRTEIANAVLEIGPNAPNPAVEGVLFSPASNAYCLAWKRTGQGPASMTGLRFESGATSNVQAEPGADLLTMIGCGGPLSGESFDIDPGEFVSADIVVWQVAPLVSVAAHSGDARVLITWNAGSQFGSGFVFEVYEAGHETGPYSLLASTSNTFYVHGSLQNAVVHYYYVRLVAWTVTQTNSGIVSSTPHAPEIEATYPLTISQIGFSPATTTSNYTHFGASTTVTCNATGVDIPASSILTLSPDLLLFDIETTSAVVGTWQIQISSPDVWAEHGVSGYVEDVTSEIEVVAPPSPYYPLVHYVQMGGGVGPDDFTSGPFAVEVEFDTAGGAAIDPNTFECVLDRDIEVNGQVVPAGTDIAAPPYQLWGQQIAQSGSTWPVEQIQSGQGPGDEYVTPGEIIISVRVSNVYGYQCNWHTLRIFIEGGAVDRAYMPDPIYQDLAGQQLTVYCNSLGNSDWIWFPDDPHGINVTSVQPNPGASTLSVTLDADVNALTGRHEFIVGKQGALPQYNSFGTYSLDRVELPVVNGTTPPSNPASYQMPSTGYPGPLAAVGAFNVTLQNGEFRWSATDLTVPGRMLDIAWDRHYRSYRGSEKTPLGRGWFNTYTQYVLFDRPSGLQQGTFVWSTPDGSLFTFTANGTHPAGSKFEGKPLYIPEKGVSAEGTVVADNAADWAEIQVQNSDGTFYHFGGRKNDKTHEEVGNGIHKLKLVRISDAHGNSLKLEYNAKGNLFRVLADTYVKTEHEEFLKVTVNNATTGHGAGLITKLERHSAVNGIQAGRDVVEYFYEHNQCLALQQLPPGSRHGTLYRGYRYTVSSSPLLEALYPASQASLDLYTAGPGQETYYRVNTSGSYLPDLTNTYASYTVGGSTSELRVETQVQGPSRLTRINYTDSGTPSRTVTPPTGNGTTYLIDTNGQATSVTQGGFTTLYTYNQDFAVTSIVHPRGDSTHYTYVHGELSPTGVFTNSTFDPVSGTSQCTVNPLDISSALIGRTIQLKHSGKTRYFQILAGSSGATLKVSGNLPLDGFASGIYFLCQDNSDPLARYVVIQERHVPAPPQAGGNWTGEEFITTREVAVTAVRGNRLVMISHEFDSHGNKTSYTQTSTLSEDDKPKKDQSKTTIKITHRYSVVKDALQNEGTSTSVTQSTMTLDAYGRMSEQQVVSGNVWAEPTNPYAHGSGGGSGGTSGTVAKVARADKRVFTYYDDVSSAGGGFGRLDQSVGGGTDPNFLDPENFSGPNAQPNGPYGGSPQGVKFGYNDYGDLITITSSSRSCSSTTPDAYTKEQETTKFHRNDAGQVFLIETPLSGDATAGRRSEAWFFYDVDGRLCREVKTFDSTFSAGHLAPPDPNQPDSRKDTPDGSMLTAFPRPASLRDDGWVHTEYQYNDYGELESETQDVDVGPTVTATTHYAYDGNGRRSKETDAEGRIVEFKYNQRDLLWKTLVGPAGRQSVYERTYDANGNLLTVKDPVGHVTSFEYDGFNRLVAELHPKAAASGILAHVIKHDKAWEGRTVQDGWGSYSGTGSVLSIECTRSTWTEFDELGRPIRTYNLAKSSAGNALAHSTQYQGSSASVHAVRLDERGQPFYEFGLGGENTSRGGGQSVVLGTNQHWATGHLNAKTLGENLAKEYYDYYLSGDLLGVTAGATHYDDGESTYGTLQTTYLRDASGNVKDVQIGTYSSPRSVTSAALNSQGWAEKTTDETGRFVETEFNLVGWPRKTTVGNGTASISTEMQYDKTGLLIQETATRSGTPLETKYEHNDKGQLSKVDRPGIGETSYFYDLAGRLVAELRKKDNLVVSNEYFQDGSLHTRTVNFGAKIEEQGAGYKISDGLLVRKEVFAYNDFGEIISAIVQDGAGVIQNKLTMERNSFGQIDEQCLYVYEAGELVEVEIGGHAYDEATLGFESAYNMNLTEVFKNKQSVWKMTAEYDSQGRRRITGFWDRRRLAQWFDGQVPTMIKEFKPSQPLSAFNPGGLEVISYETLFGHVAGRRYGTNTSGSIAQFDQSVWGSIQGVYHAVQKSSGKTLFSATELFHDKAGNHVIERRRHQGGLSKLATYDHAGRLSKSFSGHLLNLTATLPARILDNTDDYVANATNKQYQWRRDFSQDDVDNINSYSDYLDGSTEADSKTSQPLADGTQALLNVIGTHSSSGSSLFQYDLVGNLTYNPTTELSYEYNYRGQLTAVKKGTDILRSMEYDCFGRMVRQVEAPGKEEERGTIFVPNPGFGGDGEGADTAAEVSYTRGLPDAQGKRAYICLEVVQFTYGAGSIGGSLARKRLLEFVAYRIDGPPYHRFLHEDTQGNTVATTNIRGDMLDEYDYTEYGVPLHARVLVPGYRITNVEKHPAHATTHKDVSIVSIQAQPGLFEANELVGAELRLVRHTPGSAQDVYACATVISHTTSQAWIHDPGNAIAVEWKDSTGKNHFELGLGGIYDLNSGFVHGVMDHNPGTVTTGSTGTFSANSWNAEACTYIEVDNAPFQSWMATWATSSVATLQTPLKITVGPGPGGPTDFTEVTVLGVLAPAAWGGYTKLAVQGIGLGDYIGPGKWYWISGTRNKERGAQSGRWTTDPTPGTTTTFTLHNYAALTTEMIGWVLQPNVNEAVYVPISGVSESTHQVSVRGSYSSIASSGTWFRIYAPPGVDRGAVHGGQAGTFSRSVCGESSRCLYGCYRYETPNVGFHVMVNANLSEIRDRQPQTSTNYAGLYYTLHRHYDPLLMRFTSQDPAAAPSYNLFVYGSNAPNMFYDPDGLWAVRYGAGYRGDGSTADNWLYAGVEAMANIWHGLGVAGAYPVELGMYAFGSPIEPHLHVGLRQMADNFVERALRYMDGGSGKAGAMFYASLWTVGDFTGYTGVHEYITRTDTVTGEQLSDHQARVRGITGVFGLAMTATGAAYALPVVRGLARAAGRATLAGLRAAGKGARGLLGGVRNVLTPSNWRWQTLPHTMGSFIGVPRGMKIPYYVGPRKTLFHYTNEVGYEGILSSGRLRPSTRARTPKDARYGDGQYFTDIEPGSVSAGSLSAKLMGRPIYTYKFTHFIEIDITGLKVVKGRNGVYVVRGSKALDISNRVKSHGAVPFPN
ncbi:MAG: hypothetical protein ICCCNLDF_03624 [Planctomycetes bacterium]|nr:hypothetical protein [Planctomycetota bacterium]